MGGKSQEACQAEAARRHWTTGKGNFEGRLLDYRIVLASGALPKARFTKLSQLAGNSARHARDVKTVGWSAKLR